MYSSIAPLQPASVAELAQTALAQAQHLVAADSESAALAALLKSMAVTMVSNRGTQVWPRGSLLTECVNHYRVRFEFADLVAAVATQKSFATARTVQPACAATNTNPVVGNAGAGVLESYLLHLASAVSRQMRVASVEFLAEIDGKKMYSLAQGQ